MQSRQRVTLTLPLDVLEEAKALSQGNLSRFVGSSLREHLQGLRRKKLRADLVAGYTAGAELDLEIAEAFRFSDHETAQRTEGEDQE